MDKNKSDDRVRRSRTERRKTQTKQHRRRTHSRLVPEDCSKVWTSQRVFKLQKVRIPSLCPLNGDPPKVLPRGKKKREENMKNYCLILPKSAYERSCREKREEKACKKVPNNLCKGKQRKMEKHLFFSVKIETRKGCLGNLESILPIVSRKENVSLLKLPESASRWWLFFVKLQVCVVKMRKNGLCTYIRAGKW